MPSRNDFSSRLYRSDDPKTIICQLCSNFYDLGWVTGSGGGMSIKVDDVVYVAPSGVQKEDLIVNDVFTLSASNKDVIIEPPSTPNLKQSACTPLWYEVFKHRPKARSVIHTHSMNAQLCTLLNAGDKWSALCLSCRLPGLSPGRFPFVSSLTISSKFLRPLHTS